MSKKEKMLDLITTRILLFFQKNRTDSKENKNDGTISAEDFIAGLFNILYEKDQPGYIRTDNLKKNYPGIDVLSEKKKQGIQVTVRKDSQKIKDTFKKIPSFSDNTLYSDVLFIIQDAELPENLKKFKSPYEGYNLQILSATEIFRRIRTEATEMEHMEKICVYVQDSLVMPDAVMEGRNVDAEMFRILFNSLNNSLKQGSLENNDGDESPVYKTSPLEKKKKFKNEWPVLEQIYKDSFGLKQDGSESGRLVAYHKYIKEAFSQDLNEVDKGNIQSYLKTQSTIILHESSGDPVKGINRLVSKMKKELDLGFVPDSHMLSFLLTMFFTCDVFPLIRE